jgi:hypothetical protein
MLKSTSLWIDTAPVFPAGPLTRDLAADVCVVGPDISHRESILLEDTEATEKAAGRSFAAPRSARRTTLAAADSVVRAARLREIVSVRLRDLGVSVFFLISVFL